MRPSGISIGDFNLRVTFYPQSSDLSSRDAFGNPTLNEGTAIERWAKVTANNKSYVRGDGGLEYRDEFIIICRKPLTGISEGDRVVFDSQDLRIESAKESDLNHIEFKAVGKE